MTRELMAPSDRKSSLAENPDNPITPLLNAVVNGGITAETAKQIFELYRNVGSDNARKAFAKSKAAMQADLPRVIAARVIENRDGTARSSYASFDDIDQAIKPHLIKHGFSISFTMRIDTVGGKDRICAVCKLLHEDGHSETNEFAVRISAPPGCNDAQADFSTRSYARRGAICDALNIAFERDNDGRHEDDYITREKAEELQHRVTATGRNVAKFLKLGDAEDFYSIRESKVSVLEKILDDAETLARQQEKTAPPSRTIPADWNIFFEAMCQVAMTKTPLVTEDELRTGLGLAVLGIRMKGQENKISIDQKAEWMDAFVAGNLDLTTGKIARL